MGYAPDQCIYNAAVAAFQARGNSSASTGEQMKVNTKPISKLNHLNFIFFEKVLAGVRNGYMTPLQAGRARCHYDLKWSALWLRVCIHFNISIN